MLLEVVEEAEEKFRVFCVIIERLLNEVNRYFLGIVLSVLRH